MTIGYHRNSDDKILATCPCCGRFVSEETGLYLWVEESPDGISVFCGDDCARRYEQKGGVLIDGDGVPYRFDELAQ